MASVQWLSARDDMQWLREVHGVPRGMRCALLTGNDDSPEKIEAWKVLEPNVGDPPDFVKEWPDAKEF